MVEGVEHDLAWMWRRRLKLGVGVRRRDHLESGGDGRYAQGGLAVALLLMVMTPSR